MSDVFCEMSKVTIKPVVNYTVLQIFLISSLNFTLISGGLLHSCGQDIPYFHSTHSRALAYLYLVPFLNLSFLLLHKFIGGLT